MAGAPKGNKNGTKLKEPNYRQEAYKQYCAHIAAGYSKKSWHFKHPTDIYKSLCYETMERYMEENPIEFHPILKQIADAEGMKWYEDEGRKIMQGKEWEFRTGDWRECLTGLRKDDFVYLDPPYIGRHTDYYNQWSESDSADLAQIAQSLPCGFALSMWKENKYRSNPYLTRWNGVEQRTITHFYHVGSTENLRNSMEEALLIKQGHETPCLEKEETAKALQMSMAL